jgi:transcriptional regulator with XRE-family HTH domain
MDKENIITEVWGRSLRSLREARRWSQRDLARRTGRSQARISQIEHGHEDMRLATLVSVLGALGYELIAVPREQLPLVQKILPQGALSSSIASAPQVSDRPYSILDEIFIPDPDEEEDEEKSSPR